MDYSNSAYVYEKCSACVPRCPTTWNVNAVQSAFNLYDNGQRRMIDRTDLMTRFEQRPSMVAADCKPPSSSVVATNGLQSIAPIGCSSTTLTIATMNHHNNRNFVHVKQQTSPNGGIDCTSDYWSSLSDSDSLPSPLFEVSDI